MNPSVAPDTQGPRVKTMACLAGISLERDVPIEDISEYIHELDNVVWMDVMNPGPAELGMLLAEFGFHPLALEDVANGQQRPKVDEYKDHMFVVTYGVSPAAGESAGTFTTYEVDLFIGRNYVVSIQRGRSALEGAFDHWTGGGVRLREGVGFLVYTIMDAIIDGYFPIIDAIENALVERETETFTRARDDDGQSLLQLKRSLFTLRRLLSPLRETFNLFLRRDHPFFAADTREYFQDVYDHVLRILDVVDTEREMVTSVLDARLMVISNRLNITMKMLTVVSVLVGTVGCIFSAWGMNVGGIPFTKNGAGFWEVVTCTIIFTVTGLLVSRKKGWL